MHPLINSGDVRTIFADCLLNCGLKSYIDFKDIISLRGVNKDLRDNIVNVNTMIISDIHNLYKLIGYNNGDNTDMLSLFKFTLDDIRSKNNLALRHACKNGYLNTAKYLVGKGLNVDDMRARNNYALRWACENGHLYVVKYLVGKGLDVNDMWGQNKY